jgi:uncharacterized LabA/DUF88 family protein
MTKNSSSKFKINLKKYLKGKTIAFVDYANIKAWAREKNLAFDLEVLYQYLKNLGVEKILFYYGTDPKNSRSHAFLTKMHQIGFEVITKPVKYIKISLFNLFHQPQNKEALKKLSLEIQKAILKEIKQLEQKKIRLLFPKANFDVEMTLDMALFEKSFSYFLVFSGDSELLTIIKHLKSKGKKIVVLAGKKYLAGELLKEADGIGKIN